MVFDIETLKQLLTDEVQQRREEGCDVTGIKSQIRSAARDPKALSRLYDRLDRLAVKKSFTFHEPDDWDELLAARPPGPARIDHSLSEAAIRDRIRGAFVGRCAGCLLGKPVEGWDAERIIAALKKDGAYPLSGYFRASTIRKGDNKNPHLASTVGHITAMPRDDDIDYTVLGIHYLKQHGPGFSTADVAAEWLGRLPYHRVYTAERVAYRNLVGGLAPPQSATFRNPYREWIGAQIRADAFGYCAPGLPATAAEFAYRDATLSHTKNGVYGEMLFAAIIAAALASDDLEQAILAGLAQIPANCRLAHAVRDTIKWSNADKDWLTTFDAIKRKYGRYHRVHTINNAAVVIMALIHGRRSLGRTITIAVMAGWDTDCNGATAGSVLGAMLGARALPLKWVRPMHNRLRSDVVGYDNSSITGLADVAYDLSKQVRRLRAGRRARR